MAQFGRALRSGRRGRVFESRHPDHKKQNGIRHSAFYFLCANSEQAAATSRTRDVGQNLSGKGFAAITGASRNHNGDTPAPLLIQSPPRSPRATRESRHPDHKKQNGIRHSAFYFLCAHADHRLLLAVSEPSPTSESRFAASSRILYLSTFPAAFIGNASTNSI